MKRLVLAAALLPLCLLRDGGIANAQQLQEVVAADTIALRADQARTYTLGQPVNRFSLSVEDIAQITPETDRVFTVRGLKPGRVLMTAYAADGQVVHRSNIVVEQTEGLVRIYQADVKDYIGFFCTSRSCGRADPDVKPLPYGSSVSETQQKSEGSSATPTRDDRSGTK